MPKTVRLSALHSACGVLRVFSHEKAVLCSVEGSVSDINRGPALIPSLYSAPYRTTHTTTNVSKEDVFSRNKFVNSRKQIYELYF